MKNTPLGIGELGLVEQLAAKYNAEKGLADIIESLETSAQMPDLKEIFGNHLQLVNDRIQRMEELLKAVGNTYGFSVNEVAASA